MSQSPLCILVGQVGKHVFHHQARFSWETSRWLIKRGEGGLFQIHYHHVPMRLSKGSPSFKIVLQDIPNNTLYLPHMVCPKFNSLDGVVFTSSLLGFPSKVQLSCTQNFGWMKNNIQIAWNCHFDNTFTLKGYHSYVNLVHIWCWWIDSWHISPSWHVHIILTLSDKENVKNKEQW